MTKTAPIRAQSNQDVPLVTVTMGGDSDLTGVGIGFDESAVAATLAPSDALVSTDCDCNPVPASLRSIHHLGEGGMLANFLARNGLALEKNLPIFYDRGGPRWANTVHLSGLASGSDAAESWVVVFEWACTSRVGGVDLGTPVWKYGASVSRFAATRTDSRILATFTSTGPCIDGLLNFSFALDLGTRTVETDPGHVVNDFAFHDDIGLFGGTYYARNPVLRFEVGVTRNLPVFTRIDAGSIDPLGA